MLRTKCSIMSIETESCSDQVCVFSLYDADSRLWHTVVITRRHDVVLVAVGDARCVFLALFDVVAYLLQLTLVDVFLHLQ